jgi:hypothetical protein
MAQAIKCLPNKKKPLSSNTSITKERERQKERGRKGEKERERG